MCILEYNHYRGLSVLLIRSEHQHLFKIRLLRFGAESCNTNTVNTIKQSPFKFKTCKHDNI